MSKVTTVSYASIELDIDFNARKSYNKKRMTELKDSIAAHGLLQPIGLCKGVGEDKSKYGIVFGFRRYLAITQLREELGDDAYDKVPAVVLEGTLDELRALNKIENLEREDLSPAEVAMGIKKMADAGMNQRTIAAKLGRPQSWVSYHYKAATKLGSVAWDAFAAGDLTLEHALHIADVPEEEQEKVVKKVIGAASRSEIGRAHV